MRSPALLLATLLTLPLDAQQGTRVPADVWMRYDDVAEAGFDPAKLDQARATWEGLPSSAFLVVADGAVVAAWGEVERRFMCHSVRKSFLSALYGIYWDRGELELNKTLADLGLDDAPEPLLESEKRARILDLLKARSGVFHPAAYAGRTDSRPRGSEGPGRYFAYNNWDFNTLAHILRQETEADVFEAFDEHFAAPLGMQDYRVSDGYYHYELDKSLYPAYPFRMSARDAARFGLLFTRLGSWGGERILSRNWVRRSTALYSIDSPVVGYGFMWWVFREPRFEKHGMVAALGVGNQMIAALPDSDLVIVNRANTYADESTPRSALLALIADVLEARTGEPSSDPRLVPLEPQERDPRLTSSSEAELDPFAGTFSSPPAPFGRPRVRRVELRVEGGRLVGQVESWGTFDLHLQPDGTFVEADSLNTYYLVREDPAAGFACGNGPGVAHLPFAGLAQPDEVLGAALLAAARGEEQLALSCLELPALPALGVELAHCGLSALAGDLEAATDDLRALVDEARPDEIEGGVNDAGYGLMQLGEHEAARLLFELNVEVFPRSSNTWDSLAEANRMLGNAEEALEYYERSLDLNSRNENARAMIERIRGEQDG
ncbi:MAG: serine hydrolase [Planctomycetota bacterium]